MGQVFWDTVFEMEISVQEVSAECSQYQHLRGREGSRTALWQRAMGSLYRCLSRPQRCAAAEMTFGVVQVEMREPDLYILCTGCRLLSEKGHDLGLDGPLQPRAIPGQG